MSPVFDAEFKKKWFGNYTASARILMGMVRWLWTIVMPGMAFMVFWLSDNIMSLGIWEWPVSLVAGGFLYALKKAIFPDTVL